MLGGLISGGLSLLGGLFGQSSQQKMMKQQIGAQREFAQHGVRWRVEDAKQAGVHPLYAMGAQTHQFSPVGIPGSPLGEGLAQAGQDIGRAIQAKGTAAERAYNAQLMAINLQRGELENQILASRLALMNSPTQRSPAMPSVSSGGSGSVLDRWLIPGQAESAPASSPDRLVSVVPLERTASDPGREYQEPGAIPDLGHARTSSGVAVVPSRDVKERIEDQIFPEIGWAMRNIVRPAATQKGAPYQAPAGHEWYFNPVYQEWQLRKQDTQDEYIQRYMD